MKDLKKKKFEMPSSICIFDNIDDCTGNFDTPNSSR